MRTEKKAITSFMITTLTGLMMGMMKRAMTRSVLRTIMSFHEKDNINHSENHIELYNGNHGRFRNDLLDGNYKQSYDKSCKQNHQASRWEPKRMRTRTNEDHDEPREDCGTDFRPYVFLRSRGGIHGTAVYPLSGCRRTEDLLS